ncbi:hypothetical protein BN1097_160019 [Clostridioides difficile]|uniref:Uncharacterized protein n=1 Tax=Clostridioides difficile TaxID=1496 RepID=A0A068ZYT6_CLODI|nr:hypothetical protein BN1097_160019 [Clostridioides difficile]
MFSTYFIYLFNTLLFKNKYINNHNKIFLIKLYFLVKIIQYIDFHNTNKLKSEMYLSKNIITFHFILIFK